MGRESAPSRAICRTVSRALAYFRRAAVSRNSCIIRPVFSHAVMVYLPTAAQISFSIGLVLSPKFLSYCYIIQHKAKIPCLWESLLFNDFVKSLCKILVNNVNHNIRRAVHNKVHCGFLLGGRALQSCRKTCVLLLRHHVRVWQRGDINDDFVVLVRVVDIGNKVL